MRSNCGTLAAIGGVLALSGAFQEAHAFRIVSFEGKYTRLENTTTHYVVDSRGSDNFNSGCDGDGPCVSERDVIRTSFDTWENTDGVHIEFIEDAPKVMNKTGYDHINSIVWVEKGWSGLSFSPPAGALAVTISTYKTSNNEIVDSDINFNGENFQWAAIDSDEEKSSNVIDIQNIATHEIGHFIGLDHSSTNPFEPNSKLYLATMFFASGAGETFRRELGEDDIAAAQNLYPANDVDEPQIAGIEPSSIDVRTTSAATVRITGSNFKTNSSAMIVTSGDQGDVVGHVISVSPTEINVVFDFYGLSSGNYDVQVANAYDRMDRAEDGLSLSGGLGASGGTNSSGEFGRSSTSGGCNINPEEAKAGFSLTGVVALLFPLLLVGLARFHLSTSPRQATRKDSQEQTTAANLP